MNGVGDLPPSMSQSMTGEIMSGMIPSPNNDNAVPASNVMSQSMMAPSSSPLTAKDDLMTSSTNSLNLKTGKKYIPSRNQQTSQIWFTFDDAENQESRADLATKEREREERVRRLKEMQEEDRRKKLEELKQHALQAQKFREHQDFERRRHIEQLRMKDMDRRLQVEERRKEIEKSELERKEAIIAKNKERDMRLVTQRKNSRSNIEFAFGSSAPRMMEPRVDSGSGYWGTRSVSGQTMFERSSTSQERDVTDNFRSKRTASAQGLNVSTEGEDGALSPGVLTAHRRRTDLLPTIVMSRTERGGGSTPGSRHRSPVNTPKSERMKRARSVTSDNVGDSEDTRSVSSSQSVGPRTPARKTPSQVKAESAARKSKISTPKTATPKSSLGNVSNSKEVKAISKTPSPALSQDDIEGGSENKGRQSTPDIIKDNNRKTVENCEAIDTEKEKSPENENNEVGEIREGRKIITSEEEAKARIAEKRREMKEQKEREAELERLRLEEEAKKEEERLKQEEEEEQRLIALEQEARRAEEERIRKAIEEKEAEDRRKKEDEDKLRAEKEEQERKMREEAEKREAELQEKLRKEEEERLARKKRIEEIMARTRGAKATGPPKKESSEADTSQTSATHQPPSLDTNVDPTKPDLLGDIHDKVEEENAKNLGQSKGNTPTPPQDEPDVEKGALDSISSKSDENDNSSQLINLDNGEGPVKKFNGVVEGSSFDQIVDLTSVSDSNKTQTDIPPPIMAFEETLQQPNNNTADLLS